MKKRLILLFCPMICGVAVSMLPNLIYQSAVSVSTVNPFTFTYQKTISYTGEVHALDEREIYLETAVIPSEVLVEPGDSVKKGALLATIDTKTTKSVLSQGISVADDVQASEKLLYEEYAKAYSLTQQEAAQVFRSYSEGAQRQTDGNAFVPAEIFSPIDGVVTQVRLSSGVLCTSNNAAIVVSSVQNSKITIHIKQSDIDGIHPGTPAIIQGDGLSGKTYQAVVRKIFPAAEKIYSGLQSETVVQTELSVLNADEDLKSGYSVEAILMPEEEKEYFTLPYEAICQDENNVEYVWVVQGGRAVQKNVVTGNELPNAVEIISGLSSFDQVILSPKQIRAGQLVLVQQEAFYD